MAFSTDPLWSWAFPAEHAQRAWWRFFAGSALRRYPWSFVSGDYAAVSVWIPPGGTELAEDEEVTLEPFLDELVGSRSGDVLELLEAFDDGHPSSPPHYYLSLLAVHPSERGKGLGMALLAENITEIDAERAPAFLESSNSDNNFRYERQGFRPMGGFKRPDGAVGATTMWREPRSPGG